jgi:hypothetical protein
MNTSLIEVEKQTFQKSESIDHLATALSATQSKMTAVPKLKNNPFYKSKYADIATIWDVLREPLTEQGLSICQAISGSGSLITVTTILLHKSGQWISSAFTVKAKDESPTSVGSAITYARRYGLSASIGVVSEEDDDGSYASHKEELKREGKEGYDPQNKTMQNHLIRELEKRKIPADRWDDIGNALAGKASSQLDSVITTILGAH